MRHFGSRAFQEWGIANKSAALIQIKVLSRGRYHAINSGILAPNFRASPLREKMQIGSLAHVPYHEVESSTC
jgi:hypothetical protein